LRERSWEKREEAWWFSEAKKRGEKHRPSFSRSLRKQNGRRNFVPGGRGVRKGKMGEESSIWGLLTYRRKREKRGPAFK